MNTHKFGIIVAFIAAILYGTWRAQIASNVLAAATLTIPLAALWIWLWSGIALCVIWVGNDLLTRTYDAHQTSSITLLPWILSAPGALMNQLLAGPRTWPLSILVISLLFFHPILLTIGNGPVRIRYEHGIDVPPEASSFRCETTGIFIRDRASATFHIPKESLSTYVDYLDSVLTPEGHQLESSSAISPRLPRGYLSNAHEDWHKLPSEVFTLRLFDNRNSVSVHIESSWN